eukprot:972244-Lingulodinium_polyedra.AAC.1
MGRAKRLELCLEPSKEDPRWVRSWSGNICKEGAGHDAAWGPGGAGQRSGGQRQAGGSLAACG